jgi:hypothetical protein
MAKQADESPELPEYELTAENLFIWFRGMKIAKRGRAGTPQAGTWIPLEPGWSVLDSAEGGEIILICNGVRVH